MGVHSEVFSADHQTSNHITAMKTIAVFLAIVASISAEADPAILGSYVRTVPSDLSALPTAAAPLAGPAIGQDGVNPLIASPYAGAYNPYGYAGYPGYGGYGYGAYPYGAGGFNGAYGAHPGHINQPFYGLGGYGGFGGLGPGGFGGYGGYPYGVGAWNFGLPQVLPATAT